MNNSIISIKFLKGYWVTMRPYLLFVSGITGIAGLSFAPELSFINTSILFMVFFLSYGFGQALTDCFQTDTDSISSPYRPLVKGDIKKYQVLFVSLACLIICGIVLAYFSIVGFILALFCVFGLSTYTIFKRRWWGGPFYNGWIVALLFLIGFYSGFNNSTVHISQNVVSTLVSVLFGYANFVLVGYYKDVEADRKTGYNTFVVCFGRKNAAYLSNFFALTFSLSGIIAFILSSELKSIYNLIIPFLFLLGATIASLYTQFQLHKVLTDSEAHKAVSPSVHTYILMFCSIALLNKSQWLPILILFYIGFVFTINIRPEKSQI